MREEEDGAVALLCESGRCPFPELERDLGAVWEAWVNLRKLRGLVTLREVIGRRPTELDITLLADLEQEWQERQPKGGA